MGSEKNFGWKNQKVGNKKISPPPNKNAPPKTKIFVGCFVEKKKSKLSPGNLKNGGTKNFEKINTKTFKTPNPVKALKQRQFFQKGEVLKKKKKKLPKKVFFFRPPFS